VTVTTPQLNISNIGILFRQRSPSSTTTGIASTSLQRQPTKGLTSGVWNNVMCFGHDGTIRVEFQKSIYGKFDHLYSFGGGGFKLSTSAAISEHDDSDYVNQTLTGGSANCTDLSPMWHST